MCAVSSVMAHSPSWKKKGQGKTQVKYCARTTIQYPERKEPTVGAIQSKRSLRSEMPLTITLASIKTSAREEHLASEQSDHLFQDQVTEERCDLKYFVDISVLDLVTTRQKKLQ